MAESADHDVAHAEGEHVSHGNGQYVSILFLFLALLMGAFCRSVTLTYNMKLPYTVLLLLLGLAVGALHSNAYMGEYLHDSIEKWKAINPHLLLFSFLPGLVFESAFNLEWHSFSKCLSQALLLATVGVAIGASLVGLFAHYVLPYDWDWKFAVMLGAVVSATDPVAVVALLRELGASKRLSTLIEGESLLNDGTAIVLFLLFLDLAKGIDKTPGEIVVFFVQVPLVGPCVGFLVALSTLWWLGKVYSDALVDISLTVVDCYLVFFISEEICSSSGVLGVVTLGAYLSAVGKPYFQVNKEVEETLHHFWGMMTYGANTVIFILSGVIIMALLLGEGYDYWHMEDVGWNILLYIFLNLARGIIMLVLYPLLSRIGYGMDWRNASVVVYGGLRGAVGLALALIVHEDSYFSFRDRTLFLFHVGGICILTLCVNGTTTGYLLNLVGLMQDGVNKEKVLESARMDMSEHTMSKYLDLFVDDTLGGCDFDVVKQYVSSLRSNAEGVKGQYNKSPTLKKPAKGSPTKKVTPLALQDPTRTPTAENDSRVLEDLRKRVLNSVRGTYHEMTMTGQANKQVIGLLVESVETSLDNVDNDLHDWDVLEGMFGKTQGGDLWSGLALLPLPKAMLRFVSANAQMRQQETYVLACWIFIKAHIKAMEGLKANSAPDKVGRHVSKMALQVEGESHREVVAAREFIKEARTCFPEVVRTIKTLEMTRELLMAQIHFVEDAQESGMLDDAEIEALKEEVERDLKRFVIAPPGSYNPDNLTILKQIPLFAVLKSGSSVVELLQRQCRPIKLRVGQDLFTAGQKEDVVYLVGRGIVSAIYNPLDFLRKSDSYANADTPREDDANMSISDMDSPFALGSVRERRESSSSANDGPMDLYKATTKKMVNQVLGHAFRNSTAVPTKTTRIGSRSHEAGWILGLHEVLAHTEDQPEPPAHTFTVVAETVVLAFALDGTVLRKIMAEHNNVEQLLWKAAAGMLVTTHLESVLDLPQGHTLQKCIQQGTVTPTPKVFKVNCKFELVILLTGEVTCEEYGDITAPALLTYSTQLVHVPDTPLHEMAKKSEQQASLDNEMRLTDVGLSELSGGAMILNTQMKETIEFQTVTNGMIITAPLIDELMPDIEFVSMESNLEKVTKDTNRARRRSLVGNRPSLLRMDSVAASAMKASLPTVESNTSIADLPEMRNDHVRRHRTNSEAPPSKSMDLRVDPGLRQHANSPHTKRPKLQSSASVIVPTSNERLARVSGSHKEV